MRLAFWKKKKDKKKKVWWREWLDAGVFAIVAATIIRTFFVEAYTIPTGSMEGSLLVNDYLFVSKMSYGARTPMTPLAIPLMHNTIPVIGGESYTDAVQWKYHRLPGFGDVERNDIVVFNFPHGDTVLVDAPSFDYYSVIRANGRSRILANNKIITRPVDKTDNYIKRCVAVSGDVIEIKQGVVYINGQKGKEFPHAQTEYLVTTNGNSVVPLEFLEENDIASPIRYNQNKFSFTLQNEQVEMMRKLPQVQSVEQIVRSVNTTLSTPEHWVFPYDTAHYKWNVDNYGPLAIPKKGATVTLTPENIAIYRRIIGHYEHNDFREENGKYFINGKETTTYTFKMNYYWMMGDNRHDSADSRFWGFVPEDHVVGKAWFVWMSHGKGIRWNRLFRSCKTLSE